MSNFKNKNKLYLILSLVTGIIFITLIAFKNIFLKTSSFSKEESKSELSSTEPNSYAKVQKVFNSRCIACHSCYESPCQLNLQSYAGLQRGVLSIDIFDRLRVSEISPTRLYEDASSVERWRELGFLDVIGDSNSSVLLNAVKSGARPNRTEIPNHYPEERQCIHTQSDKLADHLNDPRLAMPFNLPGLNEKEVQTIETWIKEGAKPPMEKVESISAGADKGTISQWEEFLNAKPEGQKYKYRLTSRYLYEHLFLAHLYVKWSEKTAPKFYRLIRSKTPCHAPEMISTRTPGVDPGVENFYYCIVRYSGVIVNKNHLPYEISISKLKWIKKLFIDSNWEHSSDETPLPPYQITGDKLKISDLDSGPISLGDLHVKKEGVSFQNIAADYQDLMKKWEKKSAQKKKEESRIEKEIETSNMASNPFITFKDIPQESRYRFLLEDSYYHIMTFMKGTVCNGTMAVNAVQDQTYVLFIDPKVDLKLNTPEVLEKHRFPGRYGKETGYLALSSYIHQAEDRNNAREIFNANLKKYYKNGLPINIIWDGDKNSSNSSLVFTPFNSNAMLTVFRHDGSASVVRGPVGDLSKTVLLMDYATFERMAYDLVINFDIFGNLGHMLLTRSYMGLIRTDAENMYLSLLPPEQRLQLKKSWYNDTDTVADLKALNKDLLSGVVGALLAKAKLTASQQNILYEESKITDIPQKMIPMEQAFDNPEQAHLSLMQKILNYLGPKIVGYGDSINWTKLKLLKDGAQGSALSSIETRLAELTREVTDAKFPFLYHFPEMSILVLGNENSAESNQVVGDQSKGSSASRQGTRTYKKFFSLLLNRQFNSISLMAGENYRRLPEKETLTLSPKVIGYYPNQFFYVNENEDEINHFVEQALKIKTKDDYEKFLNTYGIKRMDPEIWKIYDFVVGKYREQEPIEAGYLDLSRYNYSL